MNQTRGGPRDPAAAWFDRAKAAEELLREVVNEGVEHKTDKYTVMQIGNQLLADINTFLGNKA